MHKTYISILLLTCVTVLVAFISLGIYIQPVSGDLTRIGYLSERDFGWTANQPSIPDNVYQDSSTPSVVVLGDSFSAGRAWQGVASASTRLDFRTYVWSYDVRESLECMSEWLASIRTRHPEARFVIIQTVERYFLTRLSRQGLACTGVPDGTGSFRVAGLPAVRALRPKSLLPDPYYALIALFNTPTYFDRLRGNTATVIAPLARTDLFSNRRSDLLLFLDHDVSLKVGWSTEAIREAAANAKELERRTKRDGIATLFLVVPDKSTVYSGYLNPTSSLPSTPDVWLAFEQQRVASINLKATFFKALPHTVDLYLPNDTHVGNRGYAIIGEAVSGFLSGASAITPLGIADNDRLAP